MKYFEIQGFKSYFVREDGQVFSRGQSWTFGNSRTSCKPVPLKLSKYGKYSLRRCAQPIALSPEEVWERKGQELTDVTEGRNEAEASARIGPVAVNCPFSQCSRSLG